jgi:hypothetical protein
MKDVMMKLRLLLLTFVLLVLATQLFAQQNTESFNAFWKTYTSDSVFQKERIRFPLPCTYYVYEDELDGDDIPEITENLYEKEWRFSDFHETPEYQVEIKKEDDAYAVLLIGKECGIFVKYVFHLYEGKWYLTKVIDESM